jgi:hypothetical protein
MKWRITSMSSVNNVNPNTRLDPTFWDDTTTVSDTSLDSTQGVKADALTAALTGLANAQKQQRGESTSSIDNTSSTAERATAASASGTSVDETASTVTLTDPAGTSRLDALQQDERNHGLHRLRHHNQHI